ncbi:MAG: hypothetical protein ACRENP_13500 [Longimicrobiales bacterium]
MKQRFSLSVAIAATLLNCPVSAQQWRAQREFVIAAPAGADSYWASISGIAVSGDRLYALDSKAFKLYAFQLAGTRALWVSGRQGAGPGDFSVGALTVIPNPQGTVVVPDLGNQRLTVFDSLGKPRTNTPFKTHGGLPTDWFSLGDRIVYLLRPLPNAAIAQSQLQAVQQATLIARAWSGREDTLFSSPAPATFRFLAGNRVIANLSPSRINVASDGTHLYVATNDEYSIRVFDASGTQLMTLTRAVQPVPVPAAKRKELEDMAAAIRQGLPPQMKSYALSFEYPTHLQAASQLVAGDGVLLVRRGDLAAINGNVVWDVFDRHRFAGTLLLSAAFSPRVIHRTRLYGIAYDEFDVPQLVGYLLQRPN